MTFSSVFWAASATPMPPTPSPANAAVGFTPKRRRVFKYRAAIAAFPFRAGGEKPKAGPRGVVRPWGAFGDLGWGLGGGGLGTGTWGQGVGQDSNSRESTATLLRCLAW